MVIHKDRGTNARASVCICCAGNEKSPWESRAFLMKLAERESHIVKSMQLQ